MLRRLPPPALHARGRSPGLGATPPGRHRLAGEVAAAARPHGAAPARRIPVSFKELLRSYYPKCTSAEIEAMHAVAAPREEELLRKRWVERTKAVHGEEILKFFGTADVDESGGISLEEFAEAVKDLGLGGAEVESLFRDADADGNGVLDLQEFTELCASNRALLESFADILKIGEEKRRKEEEKRLAQLFRNKMSSPTRGRRRPSLVDLRRPGDVSMPTGWTPPSKGHGKAAW